MEVIMKGSQTGMCYILIIVTVQWKVKYTEPLKHLKTYNYVLLYTIARIDYMPLKGSNNGVWLIGYRKAEK